MNPITLTTQEIADKPGELVMQMEQPPPGFEFAGLNQFNETVIVIFYKENGYGKYPSREVRPLPIGPNQKYWVQEKWSGIQNGHLINSAGSCCGGIYAIYYEDGTRKIIETNEIYEWNYLRKLQLPSSVPEQFSRYVVEVGDVEVKQELCAKCKASFCSICAKSHKWQAIYEIKWRGKP